MASLDVSIVIVNHKSWKDLEPCLNALNFSSSDFSFEVIVVDNASMDGQLDDFRQKFTKVQFASNSGNNGFANGCNYGAQLAIGKYLLFLNPDTVASESAIQNMWAYAKKNPTVGIVSCKQKRPNGTYEKINRVFPSLINLFGLTRAIYKLLVHKNKMRIGDENHVEWVSGSVVFMSKIWFNEIQGWNEDYWMYFEDVDLSKRVHLANGKVVLLENIEIAHNHGGSSRINLKTAAITKTEVQISKHVYIHNHFKGAEKYISLGILVTYNIIAKLLFALLGVALFFIPKMRLQILLWIRLMKYYLNSLMRTSWLSPNSMNSQ